MSKFRPMLAGKADLEKLQFPVIASPKLDGIRCLKRDGEVLTRSLKPVPNKHIRNVLTMVLPEGADGEIMSGSTFQDTTSAVMSHKGEPQFFFWMFDLISDEHYEQRINHLEEWFAAGTQEVAAPVPTTKIYNLEELHKYEEVAVRDGFEGVMVRDPQGPYKFGRSTTREGWLLKIKRFAESEARIIRLEEMFENTNELEKNELGLAKRSSSKEGKVGKGTLGKFRVQDINTGIEFSIGTGEGLTQELRQQIWDHPEVYQGALVKYRYQNYGVKEAPRMPIFIGFRDERDM